MELIIHGGSGRMGHILTDKINASGSNTIAALVSPDWDENIEEKKYVTLDGFKGNADCMIDFSNHCATEGMLNWCIEKNMPVVVATTGHTAEEKEKIFAAAKEIPVFYSANMSVGIAVLAELARKAAAMFPDADIEIVEKHHNKKLDVPSGTALLLADEIKTVRENAEYVIGRHEYGQRTKNEIGIHSLRLGNEVGTHEIIITTGNETLTLKHEAENRALFADGAIAAAEFLNGKEKGLYSMKDILKAW